MGKKVFLTLEAKITVEPIKNNFGTDAGLYSDFFQIGTEMLMLIARLAKREDLFEKNIIQVDKSSLIKREISPIVVPPLLGLLFGASRIYNSALILSECTLGEAAMVLLRTLLERYINVRVITLATDPTKAAWDYIIKSALEEEKAYRMLSESESFSGELKGQLNKIHSTLDLYTKALCQTADQDRIKQLKNKNWHGETIERMCSLLNLSPMYSAYYRFTSFIIHGLDFYRYIETARDLTPEQMQFLSILDSKRVILTCTLILRDMLEDIMVFLQIPERMEMIEINNHLAECMKRNGADEDSVNKMIKSSSEYLNSVKDQ